MIPSRYSETLPDVLRWRAATTPSHIVFMAKDASGRWQGTSWQAFYDQVQELAQRLSAAGLRAGDQVALLMANGVGWEILQHAIFRLGGVVVGLDRNDPAERMAAIFSLCAPKYLFTDTLEGLQCIPLASLKAMHRIVCRQVSGTGPAGCNVMAFDDLPPAGTAGPLPEVAGDRTATIIFTSGTTGKPKALSFQHRQFIAAMVSITDLLSALPDQAHTACWLPLANPFQRIVNLCALAGNWKVYMVPDPTTIMAQVREIQPHLFCAVPRFYEKLLEGVHQKMGRMPMGLGRLFSWAIAVGRTYHAVQRDGGRMPRRLSWQHALAEGLVLKRVRAVMGGNLQCMISGSAPAGEALLADFAALGWVLLEAYGISENIIPMAINPPDAMQPGSVGRPLAGNTIRIAGDREILVKGPGLAQETAARLVDGYLPTGDLGRMDEAGYLHLIGRKSDMFKLSTGRKVQPGPVEEAVTRIDGVVHCVAAGISRKYVTALVNMDASCWHQLIRTHGDPDQARAYLRGQVHAACSHLPTYVRPVDIAVVTDPFSPQTGELTANRKLRRRAVLEKYAPAIDVLYRQGAENVRRIPLRFKGSPVVTDRNGTTQNRTG